MEKRGLFTHSHRLPRGVSAQTAAQQDPGRNAGDPGDLSLGRLTRHMTRRNVGDFVRHRPGEFVLFTGEFDEPGVYEDKPTRQRESIRNVVLDHLKREGHLGVGIPHQVLSEAVDEFTDHHVVIQLRLARHFLGQLLAEGDLLFDGVEVETLADIAVADLVGIVFLLVGGRSGGGERQDQDGAGQKTHECLLRPL